MFPVSHKTIFVLDHSHYFSKPCGEKMNYDVISRSKSPGVIPAAHINKPLWTCSVECLFEYMRVVFDIYPVNKLVTFCSTLFLFLVGPFIVVNFILLLQFVFSVQC